jgi:hypothetical protein
MSWIAPNPTCLDAVPENFSVEALADALDPAWIQDALARCGRQGQRTRQLPPHFTLWAVVLLAFYRTCSYTNLLFKLGESLWARRHWTSNLPPSSSAFTQARDRLGVEPCKQVYERSALAWAIESKGVQIAGLRAMGLDGSTARTPDSLPNSEHFGRPGSSRGRTAYPAMRLLTLSDLGSRLTVALRHGPYRTGEMTLARSILPSVPKDAVVVMDRNFAAYGFLHDLRQRGAHFIVRAKRNMKVKVVKRLGRGDALVRIRLPRALRRRRPDLPEALLLREVIYRPKKGHEAIRLFTSLLDPAQATAADIASGYGARWQHEISFDELKTHLAERTTVNRPVLFRSLTPTRVEQEMYGLFLAHNLARVLLCRAGTLAAVDPRRLSFVAGLERIREAIQSMMVLPTARLLERYQRMIQAIGLAFVPLRPGRSNPREVKIKTSSYPCKGTRQAA